MFSVGILYSSQEFLQYLCENPDFDLRSSGMPQVYSVASRDAILEVSQKCEWIILNTSGMFSITDRGRDIIQARTPEKALRIQLGHLVETYLPGWIPLLTRGRKEAANYLPTDVLQCFRDAGLFASTSDEIVSWWDRYSKVSRRMSRDSKLEVGRRGEKLSLQRERDRTRREPIWQSIESNLSGFDILSVKTEEDIRPLRIEVKTSNSAPDTSMFFITKNEWEVALSSDAYIFHLWSLQPKPKLYVVEVATILPHIPKDNGGGEWQSVCIPYFPFI